MTRPFRHVFPLCLLLLIPAGQARGQDQDPQGQPVLPDIAPRTVEIRGQLEIAFPSLERQPLVGFNPPPPVVPIPPDRVPFVSDYRQRQSDLPPSPLAPPDAPSVGGLASFAPRSGDVEASVGRYATRLLRARVEGPLGSSAGAHARVDYRGTSGHQPDYLPLAPNAQFDVVDGRIGVTARPGSIALGADVDGAYRGYNVYAAEAVRADRVDGPFRTGAHGGAEGWIRSQGRSRIDGELRVGIASTRYETDAMTGEAADDEGFARSEQRFTTATRLEAPVAGTMDVLADAAYTSAGLDGAGLAGEWLLDGTAGLRYRPGRQLEVTAGLNILSCASDAERTDGMYLIPSVRVDFYPAAGLQVYAENAPGADRNSLVELFRRNPYLVDGAAALPTIRTLDSEAGAKFFAGPVEVAVEAGYLRSPQYLYFEGATAAESGGYGRGLFASAYERAEVAHAGGDLSIVLPGGFNASAGVTVRRGRLLDSDSVIPYFGPIVGRGALSLSFLESRGLVQFSGAYESARYRDRAETRRLGDFVDLDLLATYEVTDYLGAVLRMENLTQDYLEHWDRYEYTPFVVTGGLRLFW